MRLEEALRATVPVLVLEDGVLVFGVETGSVFSEKGRLPKN